TLLGARLASFLGLSEVVFAGVVGWIVLGEAIGAVGLLGAALILVGIVLVRLEPSAADAAPLPEPVTAPVPIVLQGEPATVEPPPSVPQQLGGAGAPALLG